MPKMSSPMTMLAAKLAEKTTKKKPAKVKGC